jgi:hypothetical protein
MVRADRLRQEGGARYRERTPMIKVMLTGAVAAMLLLAACGDDDGEDTESFVADADALCADSHDATAQAYDEAYEAGQAAGAGEEFSPEDAALEGHVAAEEELASGLAEIEAPSELEDVYAEMVELFELRAELLADADAALHDGDVEAMEADRARSTLYQEEAHAIARGLGMTECAAVLPSDVEEDVTAAIEDGLAEEGASSVEIDHIEGHAEFAEAEVVPTGGRYDKEAVRVFVRTDEDGDFVLAEVEPAGGEL